MVGEYIPTKKNAMVKDHYARLGFTVMDGPGRGQAEHSGFGSVHPCRNVHPCSRGLTRMPTEVEVYDLTEIFADVFMRDDMSFPLP